MKRVLHITPHLGGGVGKALLALISGSENSKFKHSIICLEEPEKYLFIEEIKKYNVEIYINPSKKECEQLLLTHDIIQIEWWNHPAMFDFLCRVPKTLTMRLVLWCHQSGLNYPIIPNRLLSADCHIVLTSICSYAAENINIQRNITPDKISIISSGSAINSFQENYKKNFPACLNYGYVGSMNFSKMHPEYTELISKIRVKDFKIKMIGDIVNQKILENRLIESGQDCCFEFVGFRSDIGEEYKNLDILIYLLNPNHYGTAENSLIEAMSFGVVPIVFNNLAEKAIVSNEYNGYVVNSSDELAERIHYLENNRNELKILSINAIETIKNNYSMSQSALNFEKIYDLLMNNKKIKTDFQQIFGKYPWQWFMTCLKTPSIFMENGDIDTSNINHDLNAFNEVKKGSPTHFLSKFPNDLILKSWVEKISKIN